MFWIPEFQNFPPSVHTGLLSNLGLPAGKILTRPAYKGIPRHFSLSTGKPTFLKLKMYQIIDTILLNATILIIQPIIVLTKC
jgi:hypothetical protein